MQKNKAKKNKKYINKYKIHKGQDEGKMFVRCVLLY